MFKFFNKKIVTRIAPSPTGVMHIGTARTALFNYLFAKQNGGKFILRIEDTDAERSKSEFESDIVESLKWLNLNFDEFYRQSERGDVYKKYLNKLIKNGIAFISKESVEFAEHNLTKATRRGPGRSEVIRFKNPNKIVTFNDQIRGEIEFDTTELGDFVIAKSLDEPLYHLAVVVDDIEMGVTHIIRGEDGISNTPRQILLWEAFGAKIPEYAHLPLILGADRSKLSKRHGAVSISEYRKQGYLSDAINNQLAFLGWNPGDDREIFSLSELINEFDLKKVSKSGAIFNLEKLNWYNKEYLRKIPTNELLPDIKIHLQKFKPSDEMIARLAPIILERISKISDIDILVESGEFDYYFSVPNYDPQKLIWKKSDRQDAVANLSEARDKFGTLSDFPTPDEVKGKIWDYAGEKGRGQVLWPLRFALSGRDKSPDPFSLIAVLGKKETISRINQAIKKLNEI